MSGFDNSSFEGSERKSHVDLSTSTATSSTALLSSVRAERLAREAKRKHEHAALIIQKIWRGRREARFIREKLLGDLEKGSIGSWEKRAGALIYVLKDGWTAGEVQSVKRRRALLAGWAKEGLNSGALLGNIGKREEWGSVMGLVTLQMLACVAHDPISPDSAVLFAALEAVVDPRGWAGLEPFIVSEEQDHFMEVAMSNGWVSQLVNALEKLVAASLPKKKHPHLIPLTRLLTAPLSLISKAPGSVPRELLHTLLAFPALPTSLPLPSLTHLSTHLPLFTQLLPLAVREPAILASGRLRSEEGKTYFLANLITFGITGGMLGRYGHKGAANWVKVLGEVLSGVSEGWGKWVDGQVEEVEEDLPMATIDSDSDNDEPTPGPSRVTRVAPRRKPLAPTIQKKVTVLASASHLSMLSETLLSPSAPGALLVDFARFALSLLHAFRGSPKWESILDAFVTGSKGKALERRIWREGVRGKWVNSAERPGWDTFAENPSSPCLLFLTHLYNHYLLITPDDEFFDTDKSNPFSLDEVLDLAGIWRDLSYHAYATGVAEKGQRRRGPGTEDERSLLTRGVTRVAERNARRKFADDDFWVMVPSTDLQGFVEAAVYEDAKLSGLMDEDEPMDALSLPRYARQRQKYSKRQMAHISPRLGLLNNVPMTVPFMTRLKIFKNFIAMDKERSGLYDSRNNRLSAKIRRTSLAQDGFDQLSDVGPALKGHVYIKFYDQWGNRESGIDGGGLFKEFLTSLSKEVFDTNRGLWLATTENELYPNPHSYSTEDHQLAWYAFIGRVLGKALYEGILVDVSFADFFLAKWLGRQSYLDDLNSLDKDLYKGLIILKNYPKPEELALNFTVTEEEFDVRKTIDLVPNGADVPVTEFNRHEYIQLVCRHKLDRQIAAQSRAFFSGLSDIIDSKWLRMFDQRELRQLIGGEETIIDLDDLRANCEVSGFKKDDTMRMFWRVVQSFDQVQRRALLSFTTSCSRPPLLGFAQLNPKFGVRCAGEDTTRLPSASSCFNLLKMPEYHDEASMKSKLLQSIMSGAGFDLS